MVMEGAQAFRMDFVSTLRDSVDFLPGRTYAWAELIITGGRTVGDSACAGCREPVLIEGELYVLDSEWNVIDWSQARPVWWQDYLWEPNRAAITGRGSRLARPDIVARFRSLVER